MSRRYEEISRRYGGNARLLPAGLRLPVEILERPEPLIWRSRRPLSIRLK